MAIFGRGADDAVSAAVVMLRTLKDYNDGRKGAGYLPIQIGIKLVADVVAKGKTRAISVYEVSETGSFLYESLGIQTGWYPVETQKLASLQLACLVVAAESAMYVMPELNQDKLSNPLTKSGLRSRIIT